MKNTNEVINEIATVTTVDVGDQFRIRSPCECGASVTYSTLVTRFGRFMLHACEGEPSCGAWVEVDDVYPEDGDSDAYCSRVGAVRDERSVFGPRIKYSPGLPARLIQGLLRMECRNCGMMVAGSPYSLRTSVHGDGTYAGTTFACQPCARRRALDEYGKTKILTSSLCLDAAMSTYDLKRAVQDESANTPAHAKVRKLVALSKSSNPNEAALAMQRAVDVLARIFPRVDRRYIEVTMASDIVSDAATLLWPSFLRAGHLRDGGPWGMTLQDVEVSVMCTAGREVVQLDRGDARLTLVADESVTAEGIYVQGKHGTLEDLVLIIRDAVARWPATPAELEGIAAAKSLFFC